MSGLEVNDAWARYAGKGKYARDLIMIISWWNTRRCDNGTLRSTQSLVTKSMSSVARSNSIHH